MAAPPPLPVADAKFCFPGGVSLALKEKLWSFSGDAFQVKDMSGNTFFSIKSVIFSLHTTRSVYDAEGNLVFTMKKKMLSFHGSWMIENASGVKVAEVRPKALTFTPKLQVFMSVEGLSDFYVAGSFFEKNFNISTQVNGHDVHVARIHRGSSFTLTHMFTGQDTYIIDIAPGMDAAFAVALAYLVDEVYREPTPGGDRGGE